MSSPPPVRRVAAPGRLAASRPVVVMPWVEEFEPWLRGKFSRSRTTTGQVVDLAPPPKPGQHWALTGKTGEGKTTVAAGIMRTRKWNLALDPKGEDETLAAAGFARVTGLPPHKKFPREIQQRLDEQRPVSLSVGLPSRNREADEANRKLMGHAVEYARQSGGWTLYVDEFQIAADARMYGLGPDIERMLISARRDKTTVITAFQAPAWVPKASTRQASFIVCWRTRDKDMMQAVARTAGREWQQIGEILDELPKYHVLVIPDELRAPMMITKAPKVG